MKRSAFAAMLVALVLCTQTLFAACGLRCEMGISVPHTHGAQHAKTSSSEHGDMEAMPAIAGCHEGMAARRMDTSGYAFEQPCSNQHCGQRDVQIVISSADRLDPSSAQAHLQSASLRIEVVATGLASASPGPSDGPPGQMSLDSLFLSILNIRV